MWAAQRLPDGSGDSVRDSPSHPRALAASRSEAAVVPLVTALTDPRFEVRYHAGAALAELAEHDVGPPPRDPIWTAVRAELKRGQRVWEANRADEDADTDESAAASIPSDQPGRYSLRHVFRLLELVLDREAVRNAYRALSSDEERFRGVAIELLETTLPKDVRTRLLELAGEELAKVVAAGKNG